MELTKKISLPLLLSLLASIIIPYYFPSLPLVFFAPYLCSHLGYEQLLRNVTLRAFYLGTFYDLLSCHYLFGSHALAYVITSALIFRFRNLFFSTKPLSFSLQVTAFALLFSLFDLAFTFVQHPLFALQFRQILLLLAETAFIHFVYGYLWKTLPLLKEKGRKELQSLLREININRKRGLKAWFRLKKS